jgi:hypothetical protein
VITASPTGGKEVKFSLLIDEIVIEAMLIWWSPAVLDGPKHCK